MGRTPPPEGYGVPTEASPSVGVYAPHLPITREHALFSLLREVERELIVWREHQTK